MNGSSYIYSNCLVEYIFRITLNQFSSQLRNANISEFPSIVAAIDLFRGACAVRGNVQVAGHVKPAPFSRRDVTLGDVDGSLFHIKI